MRIRDVLFKGKEALLPQIPLSLRLILSLLSPSSPFSTVEDHTLYSVVSILFTVAVPPCRARFLLLSSSLLVLLHLCHFLFRPL